MLEMRLENSLLTRELINTSPTSIVLQNLAHIVVKNMEASSPDSQSLIEAIKTGKGDCDKYSGAYQTLFEYVKQKT